MKLFSITLSLLAIMTAGVVFGQPSNPVLPFLPEGTILHGNIRYSGDATEKHLLDIYLPPGVKGKAPVIIFIHGGAWISNDKYADFGYMRKTVAEFIKNGYAIASIDYRWATETPFPAQIRDCNLAVSWLYDHAEQYGLDRNRLALIGFSAGGHLASLQGLSNNERVDDFHVPGSSRNFTIKAVVDFYGPAELASLKSSEDPKSPEAILLGAAPVNRPDLAKVASPVTYVDPKDPPFLIIHGENDELVWNRQSKLLSAWLTVNGVDNELVIVPGAPHFGIMFDADPIRSKVLSFLRKHL